MKDIENRVKELENAVFDIRQMLAQTQGYSENVQSGVWGNEDKQKEKNKSLSNTINNVHNDLFNYEMKTNEDITDAQEAIGEVTELSLDNSTDITDVQEAISEIIELISGEE